MSKLVNRSVDLPTEAQWEYACRAGTTTAYHSGNAIADLDKVGWHNGNSNGKLHPVGQKPPNAWGLYDMHGNVEEWVKDWTGPYNAADKKDPQGPANGGSKQLRGGAWQLDPQYARSASRDSVGADARNNIVGFRVALRFAERGR